MTNENWIRTQLPTARLAQMILYHDCTEEYDCNYDEEWEYRGLRDVWISHDGREFDDLDEAISYEFDWLTSQFEGGGLELECGNKKIEFERLTDINGDYCSNVCGMSTCRRIKETGKMCSDAYRYSRLREYENIGMLPRELQWIVNEYKKMAVGKNVAT